jgi:hypothetical protein
VAGAESLFLAALRHCIMEQLLPLDTLTVAFNRVLDNMQLSTATTNTGPLPYLSNKPLFGHKYSQCNDK